MYIQSETQIEVRYYETDLMGIVHHSNYIRRMGDILRVVSRVEKEPMARVEVRTDIYNQNGDLVCDGTVVLGFIHSDTRRPTRIPAALLEVFRKADQEAGHKA